MKKYIAINATALFKKNKTGVEWYTWQLLRSLSSNWEKEDLTIVLFAPQSIAKSAQTTASIKKIFLQKPNWKLKLLPGRFLWTQWYLRNFLIKYPPVLLFSPSYLSPVFLPTEIPTINVIHGLEGEYFPEIKNMREIIWESFFSRRVIQRSTHLIAVSEHTRQDLNYFFNINLDKISPILSGPGTINDTTLITKKYPYSYQKSRKIINFLFLRGDAERKNLELALKVFLTIQKKIDLECQFWLGGQIRKNNPRVQKIIKENENILEIGYLSEKAKLKYLSQSHFLLYPSFYEGFGFPALEAQVLGAIPIVLKGSGVKEIAGRSIVEIDPLLDKSRWIKEIVSLIESPDKFADFQKKGQENTDKYSWEKCAKQIKKNILAKANLK